MSSQTILLIWACVIHLIADWPLQTEWMARHKANLLHPAAWFHSGIHTVGLLLIFPWRIAVAVGLTHLLIDTRRPLDWWMTGVKGMRRTAPEYAAVAMWMDQVFHIVVLVLAVLIAAS